MDNLDYLFAAFASVWILIFGYVLLLSRKQRQLKHEIESLEKVIEEEGKQLHLRR